MPRMRAPLPAALAAAAGVGSSAPPPPNGGAQVFLQSNGALYTCDGNDASTVGPCEVVVSEGLQTANGDVAPTADWIYLSSPTKPSLLGWPGNTFIGRIPITSRKVSVAGLKPTGPAFSSLDSDPGSGISHGHLAHMHADAGSDPSHLYWVVHGGWLKRAALDGSGQAEFVVRGTDAYDFDLYDGKIYRAEFGDGGIYVDDLDGGGSRVLVHTGSSEGGVIGIKVDHRGLVWWTGYRDGKLGCVKLDGTGLKRAAGGLNAPAYLHVSKRADGNTNIYVNQGGGPKYFVGDANCNVIGSGASLTCSGAGCPASFGVAATWEEPPAPAPTPRPAPPATPRPAGTRYHCDKPTSTCSQAASGHATPAKCQAACGPSPAPTPVPPDGRWACGGEGTCIVAAVGHSSDKTCEPTCHAPAPGMRYNCGGFGQCYQKSDGDNQNLTDCMRGCAAPPPGPPPKPPKPVPTPHPTPKPPKPPKPTPTPNPTPKPPKPPKPTPTPNPTPKPSSATMQTFHLVPADYTSLANKNGGDVTGGIQLALESMHKCKESEPCLEETVLESVVVMVDDYWSSYKECKLGGNGRYKCCDKGQHLPCKPMKDCRVGREKKTHFNISHEGYWYSFPQCGEDIHWSVTEKPTRINGTCLGQAWRDQAGGCPHCKGHHLDECVRNCTEKLSLTDLKLVWYHVTTDGSACPDVPMPARTPSPGRPPLPGPTPPPVPSGCDASSWQVGVMQHRGNLASSKTDGAAACCAACAADRTCAAWSFDSSAPAAQATKCLFHDASATAEPKADRISGVLTPRPVQFGADGWEGVDAPP